MTHKLFPIILAGGALAGIYFFRNQIKAALSNVPNDLTEVFSAGSNIPSTQQANVQTGGSGGMVLPGGAQVY